MKKLFLLMVAVAFLVGCSSEPSMIRIESNPSGAAVIVNGFNSGKTPIDISVESTEDGYFVNKTTFTVIPVDKNHFTQVETFSGYRKSSPNSSAIPEKIFFDLTKNPEKEKTVEIQ